MPLLSEQCWQLIEVVRFGQTCVNVRLRWEHWSPWCWNRSATFLTTWIFVCLKISEWLMASPHQTLRKRCFEAAFNTVKLLIWVRLRPICLWHRIPQLPFTTKIQSSIGLDVVQTILTSEANGGWSTESFCWTFIFATGDIWAGEWENV